MRNLETTDPIHLIVGIPYPFTYCHKARLFYRKQATGAISFIGFIQLVETLRSLAEPIGTLEQ